MRADHHNVPSEMASFDWQKISANTLVDRHLLEKLPSGLVDVKLTTDPTVAFVADGLAVKLSAYLLKYKLPGHTVNKRVTAHWEVPASWWQHLKADYAGTWWLGWLVRWRPVRTRQRCRSVRFRATWEDMAVYPWQAVAPTHEHFGPALRHVLLHTENDTQPWWDR